MPDRNAPSATTRTTHHAQTNHVQTHTDPKDASYGCTKEICRFRDNFESFSEAGATVFGISKDDAASHVSFRAAQKIPFSLLTDPAPAKPAAAGFKVRKQLLGLVPGRVTFVIDQSGKIAHVFSSATDFGAHVDQAKEIVKKLAQNGPSNGKTPAAAPDGSDAAQTPAPTGTATASDPAPGAAAGQSA